MDADAIGQMDVLVDDVLSFWFDGEHADLMKLKWFPTGEQRRAMDLEITSRYHSLLLRAECGDLDHWADHSPRAAVALIIVLDQFSRHIYRIGEDTNKIPVNDEIALRFAERLHHGESLWVNRTDHDAEDPVVAGAHDGPDHSLHRPTLDSLSPPQFVFSLMPFRHSPTRDRLLQVLEMVSHRVARHQDELALLKRFQRVTVNRLEHLEGASWVGGDEILEKAEIPPSNAALGLNHRVAKTIKAFLDARTPPRVDTRKRTLVATVSLSGGVDSMVLTYVLSLLRDHLPSTYACLRVVAVHIDYGNRPESGAEAQYVEGWCARHRIVFHKKVVTRVKRGVTPRDVYEKVSREIRFQTYSDVLRREVPMDEGHADAVAAADGPVKDDGQRPSSSRVVEAHHVAGWRSVMFGHHQGDLQENVISNMMKGGSLLDLAGMAEQSVISGVTIWRPMLPLTKADIYEFAHEYGVPYFLDSTPKWSTRGKMRNHLQPLLKEMYGTGYVRNLSKLGEESAQAASIIRSMVLEPFWATVRESRVCVWVDCAPYVSQPLFFWKEALRHICHRMLGVEMIREKPIRHHLLVRLRKTRRRKSGFIVLRQKQKSFLDDSVLILFREWVFPPAAYFSVGDPLDTDRPNAFGPWVVRVDSVSMELLRREVDGPIDGEGAEAHSDGGGAASSLSDEQVLSIALARKLDMYQMLSGSFHYYVPVGTRMVVDPRGLKSLKHIDRLVRAQVPLAAPMGDVVERPTKAEHVYRISIDVEHAPHGSTLDEGPPCSPE